jgi:transcriptional regulator with XRE-family HTH domain
VITSAERAIVQGLRAARIGHGMTQTQLTLALAAYGVTIRQPTLSAIENGKRGLSVGYAIAIADVLGIDLAALIPCGCTVPR